MIQNSYLVHSTIPVLDVVAHIFETGKLYSSKKLGEMGFPVQTADGIHRRIFFGHLNALDSENVIRARGEILYAGRSQRGVRLYFKADAINNHPKRQNSSPPSIKDEFEFNGSLVYCIFPCQEIVNDLENRLGESVSLPPHTVVSNRMNLKDYISTSNERVLAALQKE